MTTIDEFGDALYECLQGKNKEEVVFDVILNTNLEKRLQICKYYDEKYNKSLYSELKSKLSGQFKSLAIHLFLHPIELEAKLLKKGLKGFSADESVVLEILTSHTQEEFRQIEEVFTSETGKDLGKEIEKNFSGILKRNLFNLLATKRRVNPTPDPEKCAKAADLLIDAGEQSWAGDDNIFKEVFIKNSPEELVLIGRYYAKKTGHNMLDVIEKNISGKNKILLREVLFNNIIPQELFAEKIYLSIKGLGTNTDLLNRVLTLRNEIDMEEIQQFYQQNYKVSMKEDIIGDTSGLYQKLCLHLAHY
jgi:broad-specificity NMP kinase